MAEIFPQGGIVEGGPQPCHAIPQSFKT